MSGVLSGTAARTVTVAHGPAPPDWLSVIGPGVSGRRSGAADCASGHATVRVVEPRRTCVAPATALAG